MKYLLLSSLWLFCNNLTAQTFSNVDLKCSANGTNITYANTSGVYRVNYDKTISYFKDYFNTPSRASLIDKKSKVSIKQLYLPTYGASNDDVVAGELKMRANGHENVYLTGVELANTLIGGATPIVSTTLPIVIPASATVTALALAYSYGRQYVNAAALRLFGEDWNKAFYDPAVLAMQIDTITVNHIANDILPTIGTTKNIYLAHGAGNRLVEVVAQKLSSSSTYRTDGTYDKFKKFNGAVYVGGNGSSYLDKVELLNYSRDNYVLENSIGANYINNNDLRGMLVGFDKIFFNQSNTAHKSGTSENDQSLASILDEKIFTVASKLEDNCNIPIINLSSTEAAADANGVMQVSGFAGNGRSITLNVEDIAVDIDPAKALAKGYDRNQTNFTWKIIQNYPLNTSKPLKGAVVAADGASGNTNQLEVPYRDVTYDVTITATNEFGKTATKTVRFAVAANQAPVVSLGGQQCPIDSNGYNLNGAMTYFLSINDDQYYLDGTVYQRITTQRSFNDIVSDGVDRTTIQVTNSCPIIKPIYHYEIWTTCQSTGKYSYCYYSFCTPEQRADTTMIYTGVEWDSVHVMNEKNQTVYRYTDWELNAQILTSSSFPDWNTNQTTRIEVDLGYSCPTGQTITGPQTFLRNTIYP